MVAMGARAHILAVSVGRRQECRVCEPIAAAYRLRGGPRIAIVFVDARDVL